MPSGNSLFLGRTGGIYSGYFAVSEAAAITAVYVFLVEVVIYRDIKWRELPQVMRKSMVLVGGILIILGAALGFTNYLIDAEVPMKLFNYSRLIPTALSSF